MNILIITPFYKHDRNIASVRWTNLGVRLAKKHNVIIVTQPHNDMDMSRSIEKDEDGILVARINQKTDYEKIAVKHFGGATGDDWQTASSGAGSVGAVEKESFIRKLKNKLLYYSMKKKAKQYANEIINDVIPKNTKIDVVISSAGPFIEMLFGYELMKQLNCRWICDFRDLPFYSDETDDTHRMKQIMQKVIPESDAVTVVVPTMISELKEIVNVDKCNIKVLSNGFSKKDRIDNLISYSDNKLHLGFTGSLYSNGSEFDFLFEAIKKCIEINEKFDFCIDCAGGGCSLIEKAAKRYGFEGNINSYGFVSRKEALTIQGKSDCLLVFTNVDRGGFAAKFYEYLLFEKPIISVNYGKNGAGYAKEFTEELNIGISVVEANYDNDLKRLVEYLLMQFQEKISQSRLVYLPIKKKVEKYNHDNIVMELETIIKEFK